MWLHTSRFRSTSQENSYLSTKKNSYPHRVDKLLLSLGLFPLLIRIFRGTHTSILFKHFREVVDIAISHALSNLTNGYIVTLKDCFWNSVILQKNIDTDYSNILVPF